MLNLRFVGFDPRPTCRATEGFGEPACRGHTARLHSDEAKLGEAPRNGVVRPCNIEKMRPQKDSEDQQPPPVLKIWQRVNADTQTMPATVSPLS
jgi:hypothetical protein